MTLMSLHQRSLCSQCVHSEGDLLAVLLWTFTALLCCNCCHQPHLTDLPHALRPAHSANLVAHNQSALTQGYRSSSFHQNRRQAHQALIPIKQYCSMYIDRIQVIQGQSMSNNAKGLQQLAVRPQSEYPQPAWSQQRHSISALFTRHDAEGFVAIQEVAIIWIELILGESFWHSASCPDMYSLKKLHHQSASTCSVKKLAMKQIDGDTAKPLK